MTRLVCPRCGQVVETCARHPSAWCSGNREVGPHPEVAMQPEAKENR